MSADDLDQAMNVRRLELRMRWNQVAEQAGMVPGNLRKIRSGEIALTQFAARGLDIALQWPPGEAMSHYAKNARGASLPKRPAAGTPEWIAWRAEQLPREAFRELMQGLVGRPEWIARLAAALPPDDFRVVLDRLVANPDTRQMMLETLAERDESLVDSDSPR